MAVNRPARSEKLTLQITPGQLAYLKKLAAKARQPVAGMAYRVLIDGLRRVANGG